MPSYFESTLIGQARSPLGRPRPYGYLRAVLTTLAVMGISGCDDGIKLRDSPAIP